MIEAPATQYTAVFDEKNINWSDTPEYNLLYLRAQQTYMSDLLRTRGHVFLNEVYDALGMERTKDGQTVGWFFGEEQSVYVDFGIFGQNGAEAMTLTFDVDGPICDLIWSSNV